MRQGFVLPYGDARLASEMAAAAEAAGWDGFFVWESVWGVDAWVSLAAAAMTTEHIKLGTMLTPLSRMRPWKLASETATLDNLSDGRVILAVGLGATDTGFAEFGEETDRKIRAELLDEGLDIVTGLWAGQPFSYQGVHYSVEPTSFLPPPPPAQQPRIPIWVVGAWNRPKSMARVLRWDGVLPYVAEGGTYSETTVDHVSAIREFCENGADHPMDIVLEGATDVDAPADRAMLAELAEAGATWWLETYWHDQKNLEAVRRRVASGPTPLR